jgi:hypothetical protein
MALHKPVLAKVTLSGWTTSSANAWLLLGRRAGVTEVRERWVHSRSSPTG